MNKYITNIYNESKASTTISKIEKSKYTERQVISFNRDNGKIIYTNYPEHLYNSENPKYRAFADNGYYTNQQTVGRGEVQVFFSHHNRTWGTIGYGVQIFNPSDSQITFKLLNKGFSTNWENVMTPLQQFFTSTDTTERRISGKGVNWIVKEEIDGSNGYMPFYGVIRLELSSPVIITTYAYKNWSSIDGYATYYPYNSSASSDLSVYSGYGDGFILSKSINLKLSELQKGDYWYYTGEHMSDGYNPGELTPIHLVGTNTTASPTSTNKELNNLGNWTTQYDFRVSFTNDLNTPKTVYGFISGNEKGSKPFIIANKDSVANRKMMGWEDLKEETKLWFKETIPSGQTYTYNYSYTQASYSAAATNHAWSLSPTL